MKYFLRAVKYLVKLVVLLTVIFWLMQLSGTSNIAATGGVWSFVSAFFETSRGRIFVVVLLLWCAAYPAVEFKRRSLNYNMTRRREAIIKALAAGGMALASEEPGQKMVFRGQSPARRLWWLGEEAVTVTAVGEEIEIEGPRRFVMEAEHRIPNYVHAGNE